MNKCSLSKELKKKNILLRETNASIIVQNGLAEYEIKNRSCWETREIMRDKIRRICKEGRLGEGEIGSRYSMGIKFQSCL